MSKIDMLKAQFPGCGKRLEIGKCRYCVKSPLAAECFSTKDALLRRVSPMADDAPSVIREDIDPVAFRILKTSMDAHDMRGEFPFEPMERFEREERTFNGFSNFGWCPVWANGERYELWSYKKGLDANPARSRFNAAARNEVADQILEIRYGCGIDGAHVHHAAPWTFKRLIAEFLASRGLTYDAVVLREYGMIYVFADAALSADWQAFHASRATLVALTPQQHTEAHRNESAGLAWDGAPLAEVAA